MRHGNNLRKSEAAIGTKTTQLVFIWHNTINFSLEWLFHDMRWKFGTEIRNLSERFRLAAEDDFVYKQEGAHVPPGRGPRAPTLQIGVTHEEVRFSDRCQSVDRWRRGATPAHHRPHQAKRVEGSYTLLIIAFQTNLSLVVYRESRSENTYPSRYSSTRCWPTRMLKFGGWKTSLLPTSSWSSLPNRKSNLMAWWVENL